MIKKVNPTSVRLDSELLEELDQRCGKVGCSRNDFIKNSVDFIINQSSDFDFGDEEEESEEPKVKVSMVEEETPKSIPVIAHGKILDDFGNIIGTF
jgi:predicted DNA-binding protein